MSFCSSCGLSSTTGRNSHRQKEKGWFGNNIKKLCLDWQNLATANRQLLSVFTKNTPPIPPNSPHFIDSSVTIVPSHPPVSPAGKHDWRLHRGDISHNGRRQKGPTPFLPEPLTSASAGTGRHPSDLLQFQWKLFLRKMLIELQLLQVYSRGCCPRKPIKAYCCRRALYTGTFQLCPHLHSPQMSNVGHQDNVTLSVIQIFENPPGSRDWIYLNRPYRPRCCNVSPVLSTWF